MAKPENVVGIYNRILFSHKKKEQNPANCDNMDESWRQYATWNKSENDKYQTISFIGGI